MSLTLPQLKTLVPEAQLPCRFFEDHHIVSADAVLLEAEHYVVTALDLRLLQCAVRHLHLVRSIQYISYVLRVVNVDREKVKADTATLFVRKYVKILLVCHDCFDHGDVLRIVKVDLDLCLRVHVKCVLVRDDDETCLRAVGIEQGRRAAELAFDFVQDVSILDADRLRVIDTEYAVNTEKDQIVRIMIVECKAGAREGTRVFPRRLRL